MKASNKWPTNSMENRLELVSHLAYQNMIYPRRNNLVKCFRKNQFPVYHVYSPKCCGYKLKCS